MAGTGDVLGRRAVVALGAIRVQGIDLDGARMHGVLLDVWGTVLFLSTKSIAYP